ncbi:hypothetical protein FACS1894109_19090 [Spirochaetia bacterium]|nr:hypothetical protein FACS1894109_19090 [Spirochaetia bacterium]
MNRKMGMAAILVVMLILAAFPLAAQVNPGSSTARATQWLFGTDVDDYLNYHRFGQVAFDKWFGYAGASTNQFNLGYATKFGGTYLGLAYQGNISTGHTDNDQRIEATRDADRAAKITQTVTRDDYLRDEAQFANGINALLGFGTIGIKVGFWEDLSVYNQPSDGVSNVNQVTESAGGTVKAYGNPQNEDYSRVVGSLKPSVGFGMALNLGALELKPYADVALDIYQNHEKQQTNNGYTEVNGVLASGKTTTYRDISADAIKIGANLGAEIVLAKNGTSEINLGLGYRLNTNIYSNKYDLLGNSGSVAGTYSITGATSAVTPSANQRVDTTNVSLTEKFDIDNTITPSFIWYNQVSDDLNIALAASIGVGFGSHPSTSWTEGLTVTAVTYEFAPEKNATTTEKTVSGKTKQENSTFSLNPSVSAGVTYALLPGKLAVNAGFGFGFSYESETTRIYAPGYGTTTTTTKTADKEGEVTKVDYSGGSTFTDRLEESSDWGSTITPSLGFTLLFSPKASLDAVYTIPVNGFTVNATQFSLVFSLKN